MSVQPQPFENNRWNDIEACVDRLANPIASQFGIPLQDRDDLKQEVKTALCIYLRGNGPELKNVEAFVRTVIANACRRWQAQEHPERRRLRDAVRYVLAGKGDVKGLALWEQSKQQVCGPARWKNRDLFVTPRLAELRQDDRAFQDFLATKKNSVKIATQIQALFEWIQAPLSLDELVTCIAQLQGVDLSRKRDAQMPTDGDASGEEGISNRLRDHRAGPEDQALTREQVAVVALYVATLKRDELASWLLKLEHDMPAAIFSVCCPPQNWVPRFELWLKPRLPAERFSELKDASDLKLALHRTYASILQVSEENLADRLRDIPWEDHEIARFLGVNATRVAYLRFIVMQRLRTLLDDY